MNRTLHLDPFSGASGDMFLGLLVNAGLDPEFLKSELARLPISDYELSVHPASSGAMTGTRVQVEVLEEQPARRWSEIESMIAGSPLSDPVKATALAIFGRLAEAEASVHAVPVADVHFHEVGAVDSIVDIVGAAIGLDALGITTITCGPVQTGTGWVDTRHGPLPVPAPATAALIASAGIPIAPVTQLQRDNPGELLTPTGAAIIATLASFGPAAFSPTRVALGLGQKEFPWPNALRGWVAESDLETPGTDAGTVVTETNLDDMSPQAVELLCERLFAAGALDVWITPIIMKKGRPGFTVSALAAADKTGEIGSVMLRESTTLGVRSYSVQRQIANREMATVVTRWGDVRVKLKVIDGRVVDAAPESDDCLALARESGSTWREIWQEAKRLSEVHVGRTV